MDVIAAYESVGTHQGAANVCGTTHKTVKRIVEAHRAGEPATRKSRNHHYGPGRRVGRPTGGEDAGEDLGEAAAAGRPDGRV
jgi:hypothetical protein